MTYPKPKRSARKTRSAARHLDQGDVALTSTPPRVSSYTLNRLTTINDIPKAAVDQSFGISFKLSDLPDYTEFTNLFDQYRINHVDYMFLIKQNGSSPAWPTIFFAEDHDDDVAPSLNEVLSKEHCQVIQFGSNRTMLKMRVVPNTTRQVYNGVTSGYERSPPRTWIDSATAGVPHYGVKFYISNYNSTSNPNATIQVITRFNLSFKESK